MKRDSNTLVAVFTVAIDANKLIIVYFTYILHTY
jgi:hypothetical protein